MFLEIKLCVVQLCHKKFVVCLQVWHVCATQSITMTKKSATVHARIDPETKKEAELILKNLGISESQAVQLFYKQIVLQKGIPFFLSTPMLQKEENLNESIKNEDLLAKKEKTPRIEKEEEKVDLPSFLQKSTWHEKTLRMGEWESL